MGWRLTHRVGKVGRSGLDWDAESPITTTSKAIHAQQLEGVQKGLAEMRDPVLANEIKIREQRANPGLEIC